MSIDLFDPGAVPLWAAFLAGLVSMVGLIIAKEQRVSDFRQEWINGVRGEIASLIGTVNAINEWLWSVEQRKVDAGRVERAQGEVAPARPVDAGENDLAQGAAPGPADAYEVVHRDVLRMEEALAMIVLRLNPYEDRAEPVLDKAESVVSMLRFYKPVDRTKLKDAEKELLEESTKYLKCEWERVKKGELRHRWAVWITTGLAAVGIGVFLFGLAVWIWGQVAKEPAETKVMEVEEAPAAGKAVVPVVAPEAGEAESDAEIHPPANDPGEAASQGIPADGKAQER